jgi:hypothetical protein
VCRRAWVWGVLLAISNAARDAIDWWLAPTQDFYARSIVSTCIAVGLFVGAGLQPRVAYACRGRGRRVGLMAGLIAAVVATVVAGAQLAVRHDPHTMAMIAASGGLDEVFVLPFLVAIAGTVCAAAGGACGRGLAAGVDAAARRL